MLAASIGEHGVKLAGNIEKAEKEAATKAALLEKLRQALYDPQAPGQGEPYKPRHTPSFTDPAAEAAKRLALEKKLTKEINQARMGRMNISVGRYNRKSRIWKRNTASRRSSLSITKPKWPNRQGQTGKRRPDRIEPG
jgi:hypothetical protein